MQKNNMTEIFSVEIMNVQLNEFSQIDRICVISTKSDTDYYQSLEALLMLHSRYQSPSTPAKGYQYPAFHQQRNLAWFCTSHECNPI